MKELVIGNEAYKARRVDYCGSKLWRLETPEGGVVIHPIYKCKRMRTFKILVKAAEDFFDVRLTGGVA